MTARPIWPCHLCGVRVPFTRHSPPAHGECREPPTSEVSECWARGATVYLPDEHDCAGRVALAEHDAKEKP